MPTKIQYGLRLLILLAQNGCCLSLRAVAKETQMPYRFLTKIVQPLVNAKMITAKEGKGGGYSLSKKPATIKVKDILAALGEPLDMTRCISKSDCAIQKECKLKPVWYRIKRYADKELSNITLKDLI